MPRDEELEAQEQELEQTEEVVNRQVDDAAEQARSEAEERGLDQNEVNKRVEAARKQEKDRLYPLIDELRQSIRQLEAQAREEREEKERIKKEAQEAAEQERTASLSAEEKLAEQLKRFEEQLAARDRRQEELEQRLAEERHAAEVEKYRQKILADAEAEGTKLIPDLVTGSTVEEIDKSRSIAEARFKELFDASFSASKGRPPRTARSTNPDPDAMDEEDLRGIIPVDPNVAPGEISDKYTANRQAILSKVAMAYKKAQQRGEY